MFTIYNKTTGQILRVSAQPELNPGEGAVEGEYSASTHFVKNNEVLEIPPTPAEGLVFDLWLQRWVPALGQDTRPILEKRNRLLLDSDWTQIPDAQVPNKSEWATYRQALRDITLQPGYPMNFMWPEKPVSSGSPVIVYDIESVSP
jgi:hypothetical protein